MSGPVARVPCGDTTHVIQLDGDDIVLLDHDEPSERVLEALGGDVGGCLWLAARWRRPPWPDAVRCLFLDDGGAAAMAAGKAAAAVGLSRQAGRGSARARAGRSVDGLLTSAALLGLPAHFRRACARRALAQAVAMWRDGQPLGGDDRVLLEHQLDAVVARRLDAEGRHLPPGGRPVRVSILGPGARRALVPARRGWEAHVPIDAVAALVSSTGSLTSWFDDG